MNRVQERGKVREFKKLAKRELRNPEYQLPRYADMQKLVKSSQEHNKDTNLLSRLAYRLSYESIELFVRDHTCALLACEFMPRIQSGMNRFCREIVRRSQITLDSTLEN